MTTIFPIYGTTKNDIPFVRFGSGPKTLLVWSGGPGNNISKGIAFNMMTKGLKPLADAYTITMLTRRSGLKEGYTTRRMSGDYADLIRDEYGGRVDLIIGISYGGIVAQHFAADHPDLCQRVVLLMAAHKVSESGLQLDLKFAELLNQNKPRQAYALIAEVLTTSRLGLAVMRPFLWLLGPTLIGKDNTPTFRHDVRIEAQAEANHDPLQSLGRIRIPVLLLCGDQDPYFPIDFYRETADLIPGATLKVYPGKGHNLVDDEGVSEDILDWLASIKGNNNKRIVCPRRVYNYRHYEVFYVERSCYQSARIDQIIRQRPGPVWR